uniref:large ribosomal subunit protein mL64 n=1 Tax=Pristiophorus japonicus TaxID=55135 RepID=UPI00398E36EE
MAAPMLRRLGGWWRVCGAGAGPPPPGAGYHARPLGLGLDRSWMPGPECPEWQRGARARRKLYGRLGSASGLPAACLWARPPLPPQPEPTLPELWARLAARQLESRNKERERQKLIAANMAKMPKMVEDWRREKRELKAKQREEKARRERLLTEARERFGYSIDPRNAKFQEMVKEIEKDEKKKLKMLKRRQKAEVAGSGEVTSAAAGPGHS